MHQAIGKRLTMRGFIVLDHRDRRPDFEREVGGWLREGRLHAPETIVEGGIEQAPQAFIELLRGANTGKMLVRLQPGSTDSRGASPPWPFVRADRPRTQVGPPHQYAADRL